MTWGWDLGETNKQGSRYPLKDKFIPWKVLDQRLPGERSSVLILNNNKGRQTQFILNNFVHPFFLKFLQGFSATEFHSKFKMTTNCIVKLHQLLPHKPKTQMLLSKVYFSSTLKFGSTNKKYRLVNRKLSHNRCYQEVQLLKNVHKTFQKKKNIYIYNLFGYTWTLQCNLEI